MACGSGRRRRRDGPGWPGARRRRRTSQGGPAQPSVTRHPAVGGRARAAPTGIMAPAADRQPGPALERRLRLPTVTRAPAGRARYAGGREVSRTHRRHGFRHKWCPILRYAKMALQFRASWKIWRILHQSDCEIRISFLDV